MAIEGTRPELHRRRQAQKARRVIKRHRAQLRAALGHRLAKPLIAAAAVVVVLALAASFTSGAMSAVRRAASAPATITDQFRAAHIIYVEPDGGVRLTYTFEVGGKVYRGIASRYWSIDQIKTAKVCYDANDPAGSHSLEVADYACGQFDPFHSGDA